MSAIARPNSRREPCPHCSGIGCVETYANDIPHTFCFRCGTWTATEPDQQHGPVTAEYLQKIEIEKQSQHQIAAHKAAWLWGVAGPAHPDHPYLRLKNINPLGEVKQHHSALLVPVRDFENKLWSVQRIYPNTGKFFIRESRKRGCFFVLGSLELSILVLCEGYSTGVTLFQATEYTTVVCFDMTNLVIVTIEFRQRFPDKTLIIAGDNDFLTKQGAPNPPEKNGGLINAQKAALAVKGILAVPDFTGLAFTTPPSDWNDMAQILNLVAVRERIHAAVLPQPQPTEWLFSDYGNAMVLQQHLASELAYTPGLGWLGYNPETGIWDFEPGTERIRRKAMEKLREVWQQRWQHTQTQLTEVVQQLRNLEEDDAHHRRLTHQVKKLTRKVKDIDEWITQCESAHRIRSTLEVSEGYLWTDPQKWDANKDILVCQNGVLNLVTGQLMPHSPQYRATKVAGAAYHSDATHSAWTAVMDLLHAEGDRYELIHQFCGSGLHGANPSEKILIAQGAAGTGKGTLLTAVHHALGDYATTIEINSLLQTDWRRQNKSAPREDLLKLRGARFVYPSIEPPKGAKLDDGSIKALSGNDQICARLPYAKQSISFLPVFKLFLQTNFPLRTEFDDPGMKRRVIVCPFDQKPATPDPAIKEALMNDPQAKAAVLAWLFQGYRVWRKAGYLLVGSTYAAQATGSYWADMDPYADFARENLTFDKQAKTTKKDMGDAFKTWREDSGRRDASSRELIKWLLSKGIFEYQDSDPKRTRIWSGVRILDNRTI